MQAEKSALGPQPGASGGHFGFDDDLASRFRSLDNLVYLLPLRIETLKERGYGFSAGAEGDLKRLFASWSEQRENLLGELEAHTDDEGRTRRVVAQIGRFESQFRSYEEQVSQAEGLYDQLEEASFKLDPEELPLWAEQGEVSWRRRRTQARIFATNRRYVVEELEGVAGGKGFNRVITSQLRADLLGYSVKTPLMGKQPNLVMRFREGKLVVYDVAQEAWSARLSQPAELRLDREPARGAAPAAAQARPAGEDIPTAQPALPSIDSDQHDADWLDRVLSGNDPAPAAGAGGLEADLDFIAAEAPGAYQEDTAPVAAERFDTGQATVVMSAEVVPELDQMEPEIPVAPLAKEQPAAARPQAARPALRRPAPRSGASRRRKQGRMGSVSFSGLSKGISAGLVVAAIAAAAYWWWAVGSLPLFGEQDTKVAASPTRATTPNRPAAPAAKPEPAATASSGTPQAASPETPAAAPEPTPWPSPEIEPKPAPGAKPAPPVERRIVDPMTANPSLAERASAPSQDSSSDYYYIIHLRNGESVTVNWYKRLPGGIKIPLQRLGEIEIADAEIERIETRHY